MRQVVVPPPLSAPQPDRGLPLIRIGGETMGTTWSATFTHPSVTARSGFAAIQAALDHVVAQMSPWEPASDLNRYNGARAGDWVDLPGDLLFVIDAALQVAEATGGAFDPTLGALVDLWGFGPKPFRGAPPMPEEMAAAADLCGWRKLKRDGARLFQPGGLRLDLGGIAKGFGVDRAVEALRDLGVGNALVEVGGELKGIGAKPDGTPWWAAVEPAPGSSPRAETTVALSGWAVATSADHRRAFSHDGLPYGHTLDPETAAPRRSRTLSATVIHPSCMLADAYATAALVLSPAHALRSTGERGGMLQLSTRDGFETTRKFKECVAV